jgi:hypothetical protein
MLLLAFPLLAWAQDDEEKPRTWGNYTVQQSLEFGVHIAGIDGNQATYDTFTNLHTGPRLLGQSLTMTAPPGTPGFFDSLYMEAFGFGGDPENLARLRVKKAKWYNFVALYRRDKNYFDFNLFANPLTFNNPSNLVTNNVNQLSPWLANSPHQQITTRNMGDFSLTLFPQSTISFRLGFARNNNEGTIDSTLHEANEIDIASYSRLRGDRYQFGVDFKGLKRTTISYDQFYEHDHLNYNWMDNPFGGFLTNGVPIDPGVPLQTNANMVQSGCIVSGALGYTAGGGVNPKCNNGTFYYNRSDVVRTGIPTEQLSLQSSYFRKLDITASGVYSSATSDLGNYNDVWSGIGTHSGVRVYQITGPATARRITNNYDLGLTYHLTHSWSLSDQFRYVNWREPGTFDQTEYNCFPSASPATVTTGIGSPCGLTSLIAGLPGPGLTNTSVPGSIAGTPAAPNFGNPFASFNPYMEFLGERSYYNTARVGWLPSRRFSAYLGFRYARRELREFDGEGVVENVPLTAPTTNTTTLANATNAQFLPSTLISANTFTDRLDQYTPLLNLMFRPTDAWRINGDAELGYANHTFTYISPRHEQRFRINSSYKVRRWATLTGAVHFIETRNDWATSVAGVNPSTGAPVPAGNLFPAGYIPAYGNKTHNRYYTLGTVLAPNPHFSFDFGWTYLDQRILSASCVPMVAGLVPVTASGVASPLAGTGVCPTVQFTLAGTPTAAGEPNITGGLPLNLQYQEHTHSFYTNFSAKPIKRLTLMAGYDLTIDSGYNLWTRGDNGAPLYYAVDQFMNIVTPGSASAVGVLPGPNPLVPSGTQAFNWHKPHAGIEVPLTKGLAFKGLWNYFDYHEKTAFVGPALTPRDFHANVGTLALKYSF